jgi:hypothetical protein
MRLGKDGLPVGSVAGMLIGTDGKSILVDTGPQTGVVHIQLTALTEVNAGGEVVFGSVSNVNSGDRIVVGTYFGDDSGRVATWAHANMLAYWAKVTELRDSGLTVLPIRWDTKEPVMSRPVEMSAMKETTVYSTAGVAVGLGAAKALLRPGDGTHIFATAEFPGPSNHGTVWAKTINQWTGLWS